MKSLIVFYSRSGTTKEVAEELSRSLKCEIEEIKDIKSRAGALGWLRSGKEAATKVLPKIKKTEKKADSYDLIILGTPVWAGTMASPVRTYITQNKDYFNKVCFFSTRGGQNPQKAFDDMSGLCAKKPLATLSLRTKEVKAKEYKNSVSEFVKNIKA